MERQPESFSKGNIEIVKYGPDFKTIWNEFVESSKNGTFLFNRDYMDYHSDRFSDYSFLIYRKGKLYCLLPANRKEMILYSHQGLTYGGLVMSSECTAEGIFEVFEGLIELFKQEEIKKFVYKVIPHIYHTIPAEEDLYALFRHKALLTERKVSSTISLNLLLPFKKIRQRALSRSKRNEIKVYESKMFQEFWPILETNLMETYGAIPVHSLNEMLTLASLFPENIRLWCAYKDNLMVGGILCYYTPTVVHCQYISATPEGKKFGAIDAIVEHLLKTLKEKDSRREWFDLGTSNEDGGRYLNESLIYQKEGFGGRAICYDTYELSI